MLLRASLPKTGNEKQTSREASETNRSDLFRFYNEIQNCKVQVSGNRVTYTLFSYSVSSVKNFLT